MAKEVTKYFIQRIEAWMEEEVGISLMYVFS